MEDNIHYLKQLLDYLKLNPSKFAKSVGLKHPVGVYRVLNFKTSISPELADIIMEKYPPVNREWLITGKGNMLNIDNADNGVSYVNDGNGDDNNKGTGNGKKRKGSGRKPATGRLIQERIKEYIRNSKISIREFERLSSNYYGYVNSIKDSINPNKIKQIASYFHDLNSKWLLTGKGEMLKAVPSASSEENRLSVRDEAKDVKSTEMAVPYELIKSLMEERKRSDKQQEELIRLHGLLIERQMVFFSTIVESQREIIEAIKQGQLLPSK